MFRIVKKPRGWIVERQVFKYNFLGLHFWKVWRPFVKTSGMDCAWHHADQDYALMNLYHEINKQLITIK
ncbi:hypothetical protein [uncultured Winogradskyella sp.]|uniref:hypothetical protein n=1 Tax=uncultured Winogradskyella sp. TaxID=395353 RepID=UPI0026264BE1|nr:hypothetical protein [uncultured Winogradskyella sp.]